MRQPGHYGIVWTPIELRRNVSAKPEEHRVPAQCPGPLWCAGDRARKAGQDTREALSVADLMSHARPIGDKR